MIKDFLGSPFHNRKGGNNMGIKKLYLELTDRCNLDCEICYRKAWETPYSTMTKETFYKIYEEIMEMKDLKTIVLGGIGEPSLSPLIYEALEKLKDYEIIVTTNGTLMNNKLIDYYIKYLDTIVVSIDGVNEKFMEIRGTDIDRITGNLKRLNEAKNNAKTNTPKLHTQFVSSKDNIDHIFNVLELSKTLMADTVIISNLLPQIDINKDKILYTRYENKGMKEWLNKVRNYAFIRGMKIITPNVELKTERRCKFIDDNTAYITASGDVVPCYRFSHSYKEYVFGREKWVNKYAFGNVNDDTLINIWNSKDYSNFRSTIYNNLYSSCIDCDLVDGCDMVNFAEIDCFGTNPSCGDCLWSRNIVLCP